MKYYQHSECRRKKVQRLSPVLKEWERGVREKNWKEGLLGARRRGLECVVPWKASEENVSRRREYLTSELPQHFPLDSWKFILVSVTWVILLGSRGESQIGRSYRKNRSGESKQVLILIAFCCSVGPVKMNEKKPHLRWGLERGAPRHYPSLPFEDGKQEETCVSNKRRENLLLDQQQPQSVRDCHHPELSLSSKGLLFEAFPPNFLLSYIK